MLTQCNGRAALRAAVALLCLWGAAGAWAGAGGVVAPPDAGGLPQYLPPSAVYPSGLNPASRVPLPPTGSHGGGQARAMTSPGAKGQHLPLKPQPGPKNGKASVLLLVPIGSK